MLQPWPAPTPRSPPSRGAERRGDLRRPAGQVEPVRRAGRSFDVDSLARSVLCGAAGRAGSAQDFAEAMQEALRGKSGGPLAGLVGCVPLPRLNVGAGGLLAAALHRRRTAGLCPGRARAPHHGAQLARVLPAEQQRQRHRLHAADGVHPEQRHRAAEGAAKQPQRMGTRRQQQRRRRRRAPVVWAAASAAAQRGGTGAGRGSRGWRRAVPADRRLPAAAWAAVPLRRRRRRRRGGAAGGAAGPLPPPPAANPLLGGLDQARAGKTRTPCASCPTRRTTRC